MIRDLLKKSVLELLVGKLPAANVVQLTWQRRMPAAIANFMLWRLRLARLEPGRFCAVGGWHAGGSGYAAVYLHGPCAGR